MSQPELKMKIEQSVYKSAYITTCGRYRYWLKRQWNVGNNFICWVMLNPSTADETEDDPTIRRCISFSKMWGYDGLIVVNLFAFRATDPKEMKAAQNPVGLCNDPLMVFALSQCEKIVCAWGNNGAFKNRVSEFHKLALPYSKKLFCLGHTKNRNPKHPLYIKNKTELIKY